MFVDVIVAVFEFNRVILIKQNSDDTNIQHSDAMLLVSLLDRTRVEIKEIKIKIHK